MKKTSSVCPHCGSSCISRRDFLGFTHVHCEKCRQQTTLPLTRGYRWTYTIVGLLFAVVVLTKLPLLSAAASISGYALFHAVLEQWVFLVFIVGATLALARDARIRDGAHQRSRT